jgi:threonine aldolase
MIKYSFLNDYSEGAHPQLLGAILETNMEQHAPYGDDSFSSQAKELIREKISFGKPDIFFVSNGTQANLIIISSALKSHESVISADTGHITIREAGAIEATGHKINTVHKASGKLAPEDIVEVLKEHDFGPHTVKPKMVYISNSTEIGTIYTKLELETLSKFCKEHDLLLFLDGARLGSALTATNNDLTLADIARLTDVFTIGGTKSGALIGEAIVINNDKLKEHFPFHIKQRGAMLAKGRIIGVQFIELFRDNLYFDLAKYANIMAEKISLAVKNNGFKMLTDSTSNQLFPILPNELIVELEKKFEFYRWAEFDSKNTTLRLVTSWATEEDKVTDFINTINNHPYH